MPRKKKVDSAEAHADTESQKPKRKIVRRKKIQPEAGSEISEQENSVVEPAETPQPENQAPSEWPIESNSEIKTKPETHDGGELLEDGAEKQGEVKPQATMADIKPKASNGPEAPVAAAPAAMPAAPAPMPEQKTQSKPAEADHSFLAPNIGGFGLKPAQSSEEDPQQKGDSLILRAIIYILCILVILGSGTLIALNVYTHKLLSQQNPNLASQSAGSSNSGSPAAGGSQSQVLKLGLANVSSQTRMLLTNAAQAQTPVLFQIDTQANITVPVTTVDTLYMKSSDQSQSQQILTFLKQFGLTPQIQQQNGLTDDFALYLINPVTSINLSGLTATVYNATGVSGAAKKMCDVLLSYKVTSCNALNAPATQTGGLIVATKSQPVIVNLSRTSQFSQANFVAPVAGQVEDIRVTLAK